MTPFERNLDIWRQLWRVIERSDIIVQIVDARNPLLFRCRDLESYVKEVGADKVNFILVNKADLLTPKQRLEWARHFRREGIAAAFWSAASVDDDWSQQSAAESSSGPKEKEKDEEPDEDAQADQEEPEDDSDDSAGSAVSDEEENDDHGHSSEEVEEKEDQDQDDELSEEERSVPEDSAVQITDTGYDGKILNRDRLLELLKSLRQDKSDDKLTIGMVGYPNVGKSSTINKLIGQKKVAVSATPGKTKHFQTLFIDEKLCLCDCPGLVMPSFVISKEEMIVNGILPCDEMRDYTPAVGLICSRIDRKIFENVYGIMLPKPGEYDAPDRRPTPQELLTAYAFLRGFMSSKGIPDSSRAARIIIKDYVNGRLRFCHAPPGIDQESFDDYVENEKAHQPTPSGARNEMLAVLQRRHLLNEKPKTADVDRTFFAGSLGAAHVKTAKKTGLRSDKKHHHNRNKKEKLRRVYAHLDA